MKTSGKLFYLKILAFTIFIFLCLTRIVTFSLGKVILGRDHLHESPIYFQCAVSDDPPGTIDPGKSKDVASTVLRLVDSDYDSFWDTLVVTVINAYPSYFSKVKADIFNGGTGKVRISKVEVVANEELNLSIDNLLGYVIRPNKSVTATVNIHVNENAVESMIYEFRIRIWATDAFGVGLGWWKNWNRHKTFTQTEIVRWLCEIDRESRWLGPVTMEDFLRYLDILKNSDARSKFLAHYLVLWLNVKASFLNLDQIYDLRGYDPYNYLMLPNPEMASLKEILLAIESKYLEDPSTQQFLMMKDICEAINELHI